MEAEMADSETPIQSQSTRFRVSGTGRGRSMSSADGWTGGRPLSPAS